MEITNQPPVRCPKCGNYYIPTVHPTCPYCSGAGSTEGFSQTTGADYAASFGRTEPVGTADGRDVGGFSRTEPIVGSFGQTEPPVGGGGSVTVPGGNVSYYDNSGNGSFQHTQIGGGLNVPGGTEPVVGWLVCIEGPARGSDYRLHVGYNNIGREEGDVRISGDMQISGSDHARIAFDSDDAVFYIAPSAGRNIIKVNGKAVLNAAELKNYDVITIGTSKLIFVALCGEHFMWGRS